MTPNGRPTTAYTARLGAASRRARKTLGEIEALLPAIDERGQGARAHKDFHPILSLLADQAELVLKRLRLLAGVSLPSQQQKTGEGPPSTG